MQVQPASFVCESVIILLSGIREQGFSILTAFSSTLIPSLSHKITEWKKFGIPEAFVLWMIFFRDGAAVRTVWKMKILNVACRCRQRKGEIIWSAMGETELRTAGPGGPAGPVSPSLPGRPLRREQREEEGGQNNQLNSQDTSKTTF